SDALACEGLNEYLHSGVNEYKELSDIFKLKNLICFRRRSVLCGVKIPTPGWVRDDDYPWGKDHADWLKTKYPYVVHTEANALIYARQHSQGSVLYTTLFPCSECAKLLIQAGIKQIFYASDQYSGKKENVASKRMLKDVESTMESLEGSEMKKRGGHTILQVELSHDALRHQAIPQLMHYRRQK
ncbi:21128_t:CDS:2, partial [Dentiscutata erythropus]